MKCGLFFLTIAVCAYTSYAQGYYPFGSANLWEYKDCYDSTYQFTTRSLDDTTPSNGLTYIHLRSERELFDQYFRQLNNKVYCYSTFDSSEDLWYDFTKTTGDTVAVHYHSYDISVVTVVYDRISNLFGKPRRQYGFYDKSLNSYFYTL